MSGTMRSNDWRLRSTTRGLAEMRDERVDQRLPDRPSSSPRPQQRDLPPTLRHVEVAGDVAVGDRAQTGAVAPIPTDPVEKSAGTGSFRRLG